MSSQARKNEKRAKEVAEQREKYPKFKELSQFLDNNFWEAFASLHEVPRKAHPDPDVANQLTLVHTSRLYSAGIKIFHEEHGPDPNELAQKALDYVKGVVEEQENKDYWAELVNHVRHEYTDDVTVGYRDRGDHAVVPGVKYRVTVLLRKESPEYARCKDWVFAEGLGRDTKQAARLALEMLRLKERKGLLWINETANESPSFFDEKQLESQRKRIRKNEIQIPNVLKTGEPLEPKVRKDKSTFSMGNIFKRSSRKKKSSTDDSTQGSSHNVTPARDNIELSRLTLGSSDQSKKKGKEPERRGTPVEQTGGTSKSGTRRRAKSPYPGRGTDERGAAPSESASRR